MESIASMPGTNSGDANMNEFSKTYLLHVVAKASKLPIQVVRKFSIADGTALTMMAQAFLLGGVSKAIGQ